MQIEKNTVVTIDYKIMNEQGETLDRSNKDRPVSYIHGIGAIIHGLEHALDGKQTGDSLSVSIPPEEAYGKRDESLVQDIPRRLLSLKDDLKIGMRYNIERGEKSSTVTIIDINDDTVTVDGNHPLAGETLTFDVTIVDVREPTEEELRSGPGS
jgi:FKBP-type peptidyl-prolyl cis-trans isomerase SlyD